LVVECFAWQPLRLKNWEYRRFRRYLLGVLFRLEKNRIVVARAGPAGQRFRMRLAWQGHTACALGIYEPEVIRALQDHLRVGDTCLDVGGHVGYLAVIMARLVGPSGRVVAFEPVPGTFEALRANVRLNELHNVALECTAVGESDGIISLYCDGNQELSWTPSVAAYSVTGNCPTKISVPVLSLDCYLAKTALRPNLVKIDVEGAELAVLQGARRMLLECRPVLLIEIHGEQHRAEVLRLLEGCGYAVSELGTRERETFCVAVPSPAFVPAQLALA
jgi:FkbM family methyltransferase